MEVKIQNKIELNTNEKKFNNKFINYFYINRFALKKWIIGTFFFILITMFVTLMLLPTSGYSTNSFFYTNSIFAIKFSVGFDSYTVSLAPFGFVLIFLLIIWLLFASFTIFLFKEELTDAFKKRKSDLDYRKVFIKKCLFYTSLLIIFIVLILFNFIAPNYNALQNYYLLMNQKEYAASLNDLNELKEIASKYFGYVSSGSETIGTIKDVIFNYEVNSYFFFTLTSSFANGLVFFNIGYWVIIALFIAFFGFSIIGLALSFIVSYNKNLKLMLQFDKQKMKEMIAKRKENKIERSKIKEAQRILRNEESELLKNLYDVNLGNNTDQISQEELQTKIEKNNEIRKQLEEIKRRKAQIIKDINSRSKIKNALSELNNRKNSVRQDKKEKQKIAIPDKELDEIFKTLEID